MAHINNYIHTFIWNIIIYPCPNTNEVRIWVDNCTSHILCLCSLSMPWLYYSGLLICARICARKICPIWYRSCICFAWSPCIYVIWSKLLYMWFINYHFASTYDIMHVTLTTSEGKREFPSYLNSKWKVGSEIASRKLMVLCPSAQRKWDVLRTRIDSSSKYGNLGHYCWKLVWHFCYWMNNTFQL